VRLQVPPPKGPDDLKEREGIVVPAEIGTTGGAADLGIAAGGPVNAIRVKVTREGNPIHLSLPEYATPGSSGVDLRSVESAMIQPGSWGVVGTGLRIEIPEGYEAQVRPRSGLALKKGIMVLNTPGTIDSDYRGEVRVILMNLGKDAFSVEPGDRIAQMVFCPVVKACLEEADNLSPTEREAGGFGSTGSK
jgi:dUTP pyrophosphatase